MGSPRYSDFKLLAWLLATLVGVVGIFIDSWIQAFLSQPILVGSLSLLGMLLYLGGAWFAHISEQRQRERLEAAARGEDVPIERGLSKGAKQALTVAGASMTGLVVVVGLIGSQLSANAGCPEGTRKLEIEYPFEDQLEQQWCVDEEGRMEGPETRWYEDGALALQRSWLEDAKHGL